MSATIVTIVCIALIVVGGLVLSQGILTSTDTTALGMQEVSKRDGDIMSTGLTGISVSRPASNTLQPTIRNSGQTKLANFGKWDFIVQYFDSTDNLYVNWLPYTTGVLGNNQWQESGIYLNGAAESFDPNILNPEEDIILDSRLNPVIGYRAARLTVAATNGITTTLVCGPPTLTAHTETITLSGTNYYMLKGWTPADGTAATETTSAIGIGETGRWLLYDSAVPSRYAMHLFPLSNVNEIATSTWTVYYRGRADGWAGARLTNARLNIDIVIRRADGTIRQSIASDVAEVNFTTRNAWANRSATYNFPGYTVVDDTDYLEIDYYGESVGTGPSGTSYLRLRVDDNTLPVASQTRISGLSWN
jgi:hypothetical protein